MDVIVIGGEALPETGISGFLLGCGRFRSVVAALSMDQLLGSADRFPDVGLVLVDSAVQPLADMGDFHRLVRRFSNAAVVVLSWDMRLEQIEAVVRAGARGYLPKSMSLDAVGHVLGLILAGERFIPPCAFDDMEVLLDRHGDAHPQSFPMLTDRQREILKMVATGAPNKVIARSLHVNEVTIKSHLRTIYRTLGVARRTEAARLALLGGIENQAVSSGLGDGAYHQPGRLLS